MSGAEPVLAARDLAVRFATGQGVVHAVNDVSFEIGEGEVVALVGESGSGKSTIGLAIMGLLSRDTGTALSGAIRLRRKSGAECDLLAIRERELRRIRGDEVAMIFQEPMSSLNPVYTVGEQIGETFVLHRRKSRREALALALDMLVQMGIPDPRRCLASYPHQLSGGMRQRAMIAMALACQPRLLIADEPTTALDVTIQAQILDLLGEVRERTGMSILFITHNLGVVAEIADRAMVMYAGQIMETGPVTSLFGTPRMPYTIALLDSIPRLGREPALARLNAIPGAVPSALSLPGGCAFHPRCAFFEGGLCDSRRPPLEDGGDNRRVRCARWRDIAGRAEP